MNHLYLLLLHTYLAWLCISICHRLDNLDEEPKSLAKQANEWFYEQQAIHQQILDNAIALQDKLDREHLEERANIPTTYAVGEYVLLGYPESSFTGSRRPPNQVITISQRTYENHGC